MGIGSEVIIFPIGGVILCIMIAYAILGAIGIIRIPEKDKPAVWGMACIGVPILLFPIAMWLDGIFFGETPHPNSWIVWSEIALMVIGIAGAFWFMKKEHKPK